MRNKRLSTITSMVFCAALVHPLCGCAEAQRVTYSVENISRVEFSSIAQVKLIITPLDDARRRTPGNQDLFTSSKETTIKGEDYCINAEAAYEPNSVATQISSILAAHLRQRGALRAVSVGAPVAGAYYVTGTLNRYRAVQKSTSVSTTTMVLFGAVGAAVASAATPDKTPGAISIEIVDLQLHDGFGRTIARLPDIKYTKQLNVAAGSDCLVVYQNLNEQLKRVFWTYVVAIEEAIANAVQTQSQAANQKRGLASAAPTAVELGEPPVAPW